MTATVAVDTILQDIQKSSEKQQELQGQQTDFLGELNKLSDKAASRQINGSTSTQTYQTDVESVQVLQSQLREIEQKINLENGHYEELLLELALLKKSGLGGHHHHQGAATTSASFDAMMTDTGSIYGQPQITISQPINGRRDEHNNNDKDHLHNDILRMIRATDDSSSQISVSRKSLPRQETSDTEHTIDLNIYNDEMRLRNNLENMYKRDPVIGGYSGGETSGLESSFTSPSVHHKDFIEQYLNKLSYLPGDVITNSEPMFSSAPPPHTTSYMPYTSSAGGGLVGTTSMDDFLAKQDMIYNQMADPIGLYDHTSVSLTGGIGGGGTKVVDMLEIPGKGRCCVYFARYSYDPLQQSLNDNPESEQTIKQVCGCVEELVYTRMKYSRLYVIPYHLVHQL
jgi:hypothetical protein